nr:retrovirus-related Pol polyprotein from transposon TNT 1-94 [Tanacetum cinerariifolium]
MHDEFEMSMIDKLNFFLGLQIKQMKDEIFFNQSKYIKEMLKKFWLEDSKPTKTPMSTEIKLTKDDEVDSMDSSKYQEEVIKKRKGPMHFAMLLNRLYNHILVINPQAIIPIDRFTFHQHVMDPLDISRNPSIEKGKKIASPSVISSSSSSSDDNEAPSFLEFYDELSDIRMSIKYLNYVNLISSSEEQPNERTPSPLPRKKSLSLPQALSKSISSKRTYYTSSSSSKLPPLQVLPNDPYVQTLDNWPPGPSNPSPPPRVSRPPADFLNPPPEFEPLPSTQHLFVNINNNPPPLENIHHPPPNLSNQDFSNPPNILDFVHSNDMPHLHNMFCQYCSTTRHEI